MDCLLISLIVKIPHIKQRSAAWRQTTGMCDLAGRETNGDGSNSIQGLLTRKWHLQTDTSVRVEDIGTCHAISVMSFNKAAFPQVKLGLDCNVSCEHVLSPPLLSLSVCGCFFQMNLKADIMMFTTMVSIYLFLQQKNMYRIIFLCFIQISKTTYP